ncbi:MAG: CDC48 family AAA ATPase [Candidatus Nitrosocosmicus sp.]|uniref:CDC48 family AAA ATPase n=1 Tax=Candidatus Nitrosocosmicus agrestis TaxID=2563600 RepID=UPI00122DF2A9|nr:CDC48 family AAA ATPase [Candidatus Nitrosocosmicus sp. SS]KAA2280078.1 CDC48 family AAA ATPase [Candidatus Nitrosocosmicus sp. SS]KAF0868299.1 CDC48 family AAA ATPase [Candidatus Nitrosocosmicus sp. SS]MDR4492535.1 CDC48 family AAA ATPase [Candidatus Nitrosocosmicus sp.]
MSRKKEKSNPGVQKGNTIKLKVAECRIRDVGKKKAILDSVTMEKIGVKDGDIIELAGKKITAVSVFCSDDKSKKNNFIHIDGQTRQNAGVSLNDYVLVKKANPKPAEKLVLSCNTSKNFSDEFILYLNNRFEGYPVTKGDQFLLNFLGTSLEFKVQNTLPKEVVRIARNTKIVIKIGLEKLYHDSHHVTYEQIGGLKNQITKLREIVELPLRHPEVFSKIGIEPHKGILLFGPPGCGKTLIAKALAAESKANFFIINGPEIVNKYYGETESKLREIFQKAKESAPSIIFIDEIDAIAPKREDTFGDVEKRVVAQLLALMDGMSDRGNVVVLGATNRPDSLDPALRRPGRFDREIEIGIHNVDGRYEILKIHTHEMPLDSDVHLKELARLLNGYTGADIKALSREAAMKSIRRTLTDFDLENQNQVPSEILNSIRINNNDFLNAMKEIIPTALREFYVEPTNITWDEVGGLVKEKSLLKENLLSPIMTPERFLRMGIKPAKGALIFGPSGCGKTLLAKSFANEGSMNIIFVRGPEVLSKWVGESEKAIREIFRKARSSSPCIVVFDELDSLGRPRTSDDLSGNERVLSQILSEMDDSGNFGVIVIGITSRPDLLDTSLLRPGRFDLIIYVSPPDELSRYDILLKITSNMPISSDVDLNKISSLTKGFSGADLVALCRFAAINAIHKNSDMIFNSDFEESLNNVKPSITNDVHNWYSSIEKKLTTAIPKFNDKIFYG